MVLGKLPVPGRPTIWIIAGQGFTVLAVGSGGGCLDISILIYPFFPLSPSLWEMALKGPLNPNPTIQPSNQPTNNRVAPNGEGDGLRLCLKMYILSPLEQNT